LNYVNLKEFVAITEIGEVSIEHAILALSFFVGIEKTIKEMCALINSR
jgi:pyridoxine 5'-phosphate synthase PdxJ